MNRPASIVVSYSIAEQAFRQETLKEYTQGNALRMLKEHSPLYAAIALVETPEEANMAMTNFTRLQRISRGEALPFFSPPRVFVPSTVSP